MKKIVSFLFASMLVIMSVIAYAEKVEIESECDALQNLFIKLNEMTTEEQFKKMVDATDLFYNRNYNKGAAKNKGTISYKIAFTEGSAKWKYSDGGDCLEVKFYATGEIQYASYYNQSTLRTAIFYIDGTYNDFRGKEKHLQDYSGYYLNPHNSKYKGDRLVIQYTNHNSKKTDYISFSSAEQVVLAAIIK